MSMSFNCGEIVRNGDLIYVLDTKDVYKLPYVPGSGQSRLGPLAVMSVEEFRVGVKGVAEAFHDGNTTDVSAMLTEEQSETFNLGERYALGRYAAAGLLDPDTIPDRGSVIASEALLDLPGETNPYYTGAGSTVHEYPAKAEVQTPVLQQPAPMPTAAR